MTDYRKPIPRVRPETQGFWEGCKMQELRIQRCAACGSWRFPPHPMCSQCNSIESRWDRVSGSGQVYSFIIPTHPSPGELPARGFDYPYAVVLVELPDAGGTRIAGNLVDCELDSIEIGMPVEVVFERVSDEITLPKFRPANQPTNCR